MSERIQLPKRIRFEIFKRDSFACQYCGKRAPDVTLEVDHVVPVSRGGTNEILNLITACVDCNSGKSNRQLDDSSMIIKQRDQLDDLQERQAQLQMMIEWQRGLLFQDQDELEAALDLWREIAPGFEAADNGQMLIRRLISQYNLAAVMDSMRAAAKYVEVENGLSTEDSWERAFDMIGRIARVEHQSKSDPYAKPFAYIGGILKRRVSYFKPQALDDDLRSAVSWGVSVDELTNLAKRVNTWTKWRNGVGDLIDLCRADEVQ